MRPFVWALLGTLCLHAADAPWPQFRGPGSNGISDSAGLPVRWSGTENIRWRVPVTGAGWSSPIIAGGRIFLTAVISSEDKEPPKKGLYFGGNRGTPSDVHRWLVYAFDFETGKLLWEREVHRGVPAIARHLKNTFASETPATDGERLYVWFGSAGFFCFDLNGKQLWSKPVPQHEMRYGWGTSASPVLHDERLYIVHDNEVASYLASLDKRTGREIWRVARDEKSNWSTPFVWIHAARTEIVTTGTGRVRSYDLDGKLLWEFGGMSSIVIPTPFTRHSLLYIASGYVGDQVRPVFAVKPGARGDISLKPGETTNAHIAWHLPQGGPYNPSPLVYGDLYYTLYDRGFLTAHDARTGKLVYDKVRISEGTVAFTASPWAYDGKLFLASEDGDTYVVQAGPEYKLLHTNALTEMIMATPAIAGKSLIMRTATHLYRVEQR
ncbi:MAG: PQQ-binding-like beta-propeller repeat protein [Acidobacteria bacterium]|nr:PQQ-binding-like beta-propeller repeat protein [Acidobacteriota bacterium]